jgi:hypothetical protein
VRWGRARLQRLRKNHKCVRHRGRAALQRRVKPPKSARALAPEGLRGPESRRDRPLRLRRGNNRRRHIRVRAFFAARIDRGHLVAVGVSIGNAAAVGVAGCGIRRRRIQLRIASARARRRVIDRTVNVVARHSRRTARRPRQAHRVDRRSNRRTRQAHAGWRVAGIAGKRSRRRRRTARRWAERHGISRARTCRNRCRERQSADHKL